LHIFIVGDFLLINLTMMLEELNVTTSCNLLVNCTGLCESGSRFIKILYVKLLTCRAESFSGASSEN